MDKTEFAGVEGEAAGRIGDGAVGFVADDGVAHVGEVDADLMAAAGFELEFDECVVVRAFEDLEMGDGLAGVVARRDAADAEGEFLVEMAAQRAGVTFDDTFDDGEVVATEWVPLDELGRLLGRRSFVADSVALVWPLIDST